jgi:hypothetical protein
MKISLNNPQLEELQYQLKLLEKGNFPNTEAAFTTGAKIIQKTWRDYALGGPLSGVSPLKNGSGSYARSIKTKKTGVFDHEIYSEAEIADWIENGTKELDMKSTHPYGPRSRISKDGVHYLIIPFQWGTKEGTKRVGPKNIVPKSLLTLMRSKRFKKSSVKNETYQSPNARGNMVDRWTYTWGDRARGSDFTGTIEQKIFADGMVRFEQGAKGGKRYGGYFTFRIISENSPANSWKRKGTPARHVTRAVAQETQEVINTMVEGSITEDLGL